jgi:predicted TIM-barrel fold metal-dependent hydrolase
VTTDAAAARRFDSLVHVTTTGTWINGRDNAGFDRLLAELDAAHVDHACLVGLAGVVENSFLLECANRAAGRLIPIAGIDPTRDDSSDLSPVMATLREQGFRGIKLHPRLNGYDPLVPVVSRAIAAATAHALPVFIDTLFRQRAAPTSSAADIIDVLVHRCPGANLVLLHGGGVQLLEVADIVRLHRNLLLDVSYTLLAYRRSSVEQDLRWVFEHLDQRVVIGSDMPEYTPADAFAEAQRLAAGLPPEKWANISHGNLSRLFHL